MPTIYVVDVPEFRPVVEAARKRPDYYVSDAVRGYYRIDCAGEMSFDRKEMGMKPAIWYGIFTGGLDGEIASFGRDVVTIIGTNRPL